MGLAALVAVERHAVIVAGVIAAGLEHGGVATRVRCLDGPASTAPQGADLVVLGARIGAYRSRDGGAVRSWLTGRRPESAAQLAALFDVRIGAVEEAGSDRAARDLLVAHGFRLALPHAGFSVADLAGRPGQDEALRALRWGTALAAMAYECHAAQASRDLRPSTRVRAAAMLVTSQGGSGCRTPPTTAAPDRISLTG
ncbi:hypothetical protein [Nocardioides ultimimeridianus]